jgi:DNA-binding ferritin-like protein
VKTKNFHWHIGGSHFRAYHRLLDEQAERIFAATDPIAERVRKLAAPRCGLLDTSPACSAYGQRRGLCDAAGHVGRAAR